jgi:predicted MFS family arabinose efflux permease
MWALYALLQFPSGVLADRYSERRLVLLGLGGTTIGALLVAVAPSLLAFSLAVLLLGGGTGLFFSPASSLVTRTFEDAGGPLGVLTAGGALAGIVYPTIGSAVGVRAGWRVAMLLGALAAVPVLAATWWAAPTLPPANPDRRLRAVVDVARLRHVLARPSVAYTAALSALVAFTFQAFSSFFPTFLVEFRGLDTGTAGLVFGAVFGISSLAQPLAGRLSDATSRDLAIGTSVTLAGSGLVVLLLVDHWAGLVVGSGLFGVGLSWPGPIQARIMDQLGDEERGYGFGLVRTVYMLLAASSSVIVGRAADVGGWTLGYAVPIAVLALCLLALAVNRVAGLDL